MADSSSAVLLRHIRKLADRTSARELSDRDLLERFTSGRDEHAFEALLERHGPMILGVCRRLLHREQDAEDAFQATFFVLVHRAASIRKQDSMGAWLYAVAYRIATKLRKQALRRQTLCSTVRQVCSTDPLDELTGRELCTVVDEEINGLADIYRAPLVLCYLEGKTRDEAALQLGWSLGTLKRRLEHARRRLRDRLTRRGLAPSLALLGSSLAPSSMHHGMSRSLASSTRKGALAFVLSKRSAIPISTRAAILAEGAIQTMFMNKLKVILTFVVVTCGVTVAPALLVRQGLFAEPPQPRGTSNNEPTGPTDAVPNQTSASLSGKPAPFDPGPLARRVWAIVETVEKNDIEPRPRAVILLGGVQSLFKAANTAAPPGLREKIEALATPEELTVFLRDVWPKSRAEQTAPAGKLEDALVRGVLDGIPGRPDVLTADFVRVAEQVNANRYVGIGVQIGISKKDKLPCVITPMRRGPLREAGVKAEDLIVAVDGKSTRDMPLSQVVQWLRGEEGAPVALVVQTPGDKTTRTVRLTRSVVPFESVFGYRRAGEGWSYRIDPAAVGYAHIASITKSTLHELRNAQRDMQREGVRALVLDLRYGGGPGSRADDLHAAALVADGLLDGGVLWREVSGHSKVKELRADRECLFRQWPMAILVSGETQSASYAGLAAALQDNGRAFVVGERTGADGYVSSFVNLPDGQGAIVVHTGRLERAVKGKGWPLQPDHIVKLTKAQREALGTWIRYKDHAEPPAGVDDRPPVDPQLARAVELLQAALRSEAAR
jgi:C-terminal peptidase prc